MTRGFVSLLTLIAMLLHAVFGCCWHHAHAQRHQAGAEHAAQAVLVEGVNQVEACSHSHLSRATHGHSHHVTDSEGDEIAPMPPADGDHHGHRHESHGCDEVVCKYVVANSIKAPEPTGNHLFCDWLPAADERTTQLVAGIGGEHWREHSERAYADGSHVRALTQVWLL